MPEYVNVNASHWTPPSLSNTGEMMEKKKNKKKTKKERNKRLPDLTAAAHRHIKRALYYVEADGEQWEYWQSCVMNKPGCLSILARPSPRRAVALSKPCIVFLSCARARFPWRCRVKRWPPASCESHGDGPATSPGASPPATEQPWRPHSVRLSVCFSSHSGSHFSSPLLTPSSSSSFFFFLLSCPSLLFHLPPSPPPSVFYLPPPDCPSPPCVHTSFPLCIPSSLLPLSHCPGQKRVCQAFPERATGPDHTLRRGFLKLLSVTRGRERIQVELLYTLPCTVVFPNICNTALLNLPSVG